MYSTIRKQKLQTTELSSWQRQKTAHGNLERSWQSMWREDSQKVGGKNRSGFHKKKGLSVLKNS